MFGFFYPENNQRFLDSMVFENAKEAIEWWRDRRSTWQEIPAGSKDEAAFMNHNTGHIVVVREIHAS